jgi:hypothetical protein
VLLIKVNLLLTRHCASALKQFKLLKEGMLSGVSGLVEGFLNCWLICMRTMVILSAKLPSCVGGGVTTAVVELFDWQLGKIRTDRPMAHTTFLNAFGIVMSTLIMVLKYQLYSILNVLLTTLHN